MQYRYVALITLACTFATLSPLWTHAQNLPAVALSEISWGGSALSTADEWIEIANISSTSVDIGGWTINGISTTSPIVIPEHTLLAPQETYLIANYEMGNEKSTLAVQANLITSSVSIPNSDITITLVNASLEIIDSFTDAGTPDFGSTSPHATAERNLADGTWLTSTPGNPGTITVPSVAPASEEMAAEEQTFEDAEMVSDELLEPEALAEDRMPSDTAHDVEAILDESPPEEIVAEETPESVPITLIAPIVSEAIAVAVDESVLEDVGSTPSEEYVAEESNVPPSPPIVLDYSSLHITEFLSNPLDGSEWVELWNAGSEALSLEGVTVEDASGKVTPLSGTLEAFSYLLVENPAGKLNNSDDTITLLLPDGQVRVTLTYGTATFAAPKKGLSAGVCDDGWHTSLSPSPAQENPCPTTILESSSYESSTTTTDINVSSTSAGNSSASEGNLSSEEITNSESTIIAPVTPSVVTDALASHAEPPTVSGSSQTRANSPVAKKTSSKNTPLLVEISSLDALASGQRVQVTGILAAAPGVFVKRVAYLNGVQLYFHAALWPELAPGTLVRVTGTWDLDTDSRRIKISQSSDIVVLGTAPLVPAALHDVAQESIGDILVTGSGSLLRKDGELFVFANEHGDEFRVEDVAATGVLRNLRAGDDATIVGMLLARNGVFVLAPRTKDDVTLHPVALPSNTTTLASTSSSAPHTPSSPAPFIGGGILASSVSALGYWFVRSRKLPLALSP